MGLEGYLVAPLVSTSAGMALLKNQSRRRPMLAGSLAGLLAVRSSWLFSNLLHTDAAGKTWTKCDAEQKPTAEHNVHSHFFPQIIHNFLSINFIFKAFFTTRTAADTFQTTMRRTAAPLFFTFLSAALTLCYILQDDDLLFILCIFKFNSVKV